MHVIICGAGMVGSTLAGYLVQEGVDIALIDNSPNRIEEIKNIEVEPILGNASYPRILEKAGANQADMIIAATDSDEVNFMICQVASSIFNIETKIARIRAYEYLDPKWGGLYAKESVPVDAIISPDEEIARNIIQKLYISSNSDVIPLAGDTVRILGVRCNQKSEILGLPLSTVKKRFEQIKHTFVGVIRNNNLIPMESEDKITEGDIIYSFVNTPSFKDAVKAFGLTKKEQEPTKSIIILGGGRVAFSLARMLEQENPDLRVKIIESDKKRAEFLAINLTNAIVLCGDMLDAKILEEAGIQSIDAVVAATNNDEVNILASLFSKHLGVKRIITRTKKNVYDMLLNELGLEAQVNQRQIMISTILHYIHHGLIHTSNFLHQNLGELVEISVPTSATVVGKNISEIDLPQGVIIGAVIRKRELVYPQTKTKKQTEEILIEPNDVIIMFSPPASLKQVEEIFAVNKMGYF